MYMCKHRLIVCVVKYAFVEACLPHVNQTANIHRYVYFGLVLFCHSEGCWLAFGGGIVKCICMLVV